MRSFADKNRRKVPVVPLTSFFPRRASSQAVLERPLGPTHVDARFSPVPLKSSSSNVTERGNESEASEDSVHYMGGEPPDAKPIMTPQRRRNSFADAEEILSPSSRRLWQPQPTGNTGNSDRDDQQSRPRKSRREDGPDESFPSLGTANILRKSWWTYAKAVEACRHEFTLTGREIYGERAFEPLHPLFDKFHKVCGYMKRHFEEIDKTRQGTSASSLIRNLRLQLKDRAAARLKGDRIDFRQYLGSTMDHEQVLAGRFVEPPGQVNGTVAGCLGDMGLARLLDIDGDMMVHRSSNKQYTSPETIRNTDGETADVFASEIGAATDISKRTGSHTPPAADAVANEAFAAKIANLQDTLQQKETSDADLFKKSSNQMKRMADDTRELRERVAGNLTSTNARLDVVDKELRRMNEKFDEFVQTIQRNQATAQPSPQSQVSQSKSPALKPSLSSPTPEASSKQPLAVPATSEQPNKRPRLEREAKSKLTTYAIQNPLIGIDDCGELETDLAR